jgi:hypothetical protein
MARHRTAAEERFGGKIGVLVMLGEELLERKQAEGEHEGLIAVVAGAEVSLFEGVSHGDLCDFLPVAEDAEFGFAGKDVLARENAGQAAAVRDAVVLQGYVTAEDGGLTQGFRSVVHDFVRTTI